MGKVSFTGFVFVVTLVLTGMVGCFLWCPLGSIPLALYVKLWHRPAPQRRRGGSVAYRLFNRWNDAIQGTWFLLVGTLLECLFGVRIAWTLVGEGQKDIELLRGTGKPGAERPPAAVLRSFLRAPTQPGRTNILIVNHRTRIDWLLMWAFLSRTDILSGLKIVLKQDMAAIPFLGWAMQTFRFIFVARRWEEDQHRIARVVSYLQDHKEAATLLIFPEGSDLSESNLAKSQSYAKEKGLPVFRHVLNPRTTGLVALKNFIGPANIEHVYDVTMGYTDFRPGERPSDASLFSGRMPKCLHFLVSRHTFAAPSGGVVPSEQQQGPPIPATDEGFAKWIEGRFEAKELALSNFYSASPPAFVPEQVTRVYGAKTVAGAVSPAPSVSAASTCLRDVGFVKAILLPLLCWCCPLVFWATNYATSLTSYLVFVALGGAYVAISKRYGSFDRWVLYPPPHGEVKTKEKIK